MSTLTLKSSSFTPNGTIPKKHTGDGDDVSPPLAWSGVPDQTREFALIVDDPDAPVSEPWVHWVLYKIPATTTSLDEGVPAKPRLLQPAGALQGRHSWPAGVGYRGPEPPQGHGVHHYHFRVYALDAPLSLAEGASKSALLAAMHGHILAQAEIIGTYER